MKLCDYGCGQEAHYQRKNGKWCCSKNTAQCPTVRKKLVENHANSKEIYKNLSPEKKRNMQWNKGLTAETNASVRRGRDKIRKMYATGELRGTFTGRHHTEKTKRLISQNTSKAYNYNANRKSGRGKKGWYKGYFCDSTYELAYVIYCLDHNIPIERNREYFLYEYQGKQHRYYPDFIVNDVLVEIKGFRNGALRYKEQSLQKSGKAYKILFPEDLTDVFQHIQTKYNKTVDVNIHELYENME